MNLFPILIIRLLCIFVLTSCSYCPIFKTKIKVFFEIAKRLFYCSATLRLYMSLCLSLSHLLIQHSIVIYNFVNTLSIPFYTCFSSKQDSIYILFLYAVSLRYCIVVCSIPFLFVCVVVCRA